MNKKENFSFLRQANAEALSSELMHLLDQVKAMLLPLNGESFFQHDEEALRKYFLALETLVDLAIHTRDDMGELIKEKGH